MAASVLQTYSNPTGVSGTTSTLTWDYTPPAGSNRLALVILARGYNDGSLDSFPATGTWGGQTINRTSQLFEGWAGNGELAVYVVTEATIAAMSGGAGSITMPDPSVGNATYQTSIVVFQDAVQTISSSNLGAASGSATLAITAGSDDLVVSVANCRGDGSLTLPAGYTSVLDVPGSYGGIEQTDVLVATIAGPQTQALMTFSGSGLFNAFVIGDNSGGGATVVNPDGTATGTSTVTGAANPIAPETVTADMTLDFSTVFLSGKA